MGAYEFMEEKISNLNPKTIRILEISLEIFVCGMVGFMFGWFIQPLWLSFLSTILFVVFWGAQKLVTSVRLKQQAEINKLKIIDKVFSHINGTVDEQRKMG